MSEPDVSPLPLCEKCRENRPCVIVETAFGERSICLESCFRLWGLMRADLRKRVGQLLLEHDANFFDEPTRPDIKVIPE